MAEGITTQQTVYPDWVTAPSEQMINQMQTMMGQPLSIPGQQVAGFSPTQTAAMQQAFDQRPALVPINRTCKQQDWDNRQPWARPEPALAHLEECNSIQAALHRG